MPAVSDPHEELVVQALHYALLHRKIPFLEYFIHAYPGREIDSYGMDVILMLQSGIAIPLQIKAGREIVGVVLPIPKMLEDLPPRLFGRFSKKMCSKANSHKKKHAYVQAILFATLPNSSDEREQQKIVKAIIKEINSIIDVMLRHTVHNYKNYPKPV